MSEYGITALPSSLSTYNWGYTMGWKFTPRELIKVSGLRVYVPSNRTVTGYLFNNSGTVLASVLISATANTWSEALFTTPVTLDMGATYVISCYNGGKYYYKSSSAFTFNNKISFVTGAYSTTESEGTFPDRTENNVFPIIDIIIKDSGYKTSGEAVFTVSNYVKQGADVLLWTAETPENTAVTMFTKVNNGSWVQLNNSGDAIQGLPNSACTLYVKAELSTSDISKTPKLQTIAIRNSSDNKILILTPTMPSDLRSNVGNMSVNYDGLGGLGGTGGPTAAFVGTFTPTAMAWRPNPHDEEHIEVNISADAALTRLQYLSAQEPEEHVEVSVSASMVITDIHDL